MKTCEKHVGKNRQQSGGWYRPWVIYMRVTSVWCAGHVPLLGPVGLSHTERQDDEQNHYPDDDERDDTANEIHPYTSSSSIRVPQKSLG